MKDNKKYGCIYKTTNLLTGKFYIGQTVFIDKVINGKYLGSGKFLWNSINKHGFENFKVEIVCYAENQEELNNLEKKFIKDFNSLAPNGYNLKEGGEQGGKGNKFSKEVRERLSKLKKGKNHPLYGKNHTDESKIKMSESKKGKKASDATKKKLSEIRKGIRHSENSKKKMSVNHADFSGKNNPMYGRKGELSSMYGKTGKENPFYGKKHSEESKEKIRKSLALRKLKNINTYL